MLSSIVSIAFFNRIGFVADMYVFAMFASQEGELRVAWALVGMPDVLSAMMSEHVVNLIVLEGLEQDPRILLGRKSHHQKKTREKVPKKK